MRHSEFRKSERPSRNGNARRATRMSKAEAAASTPSVVSQDEQPKKSNKRYANYARKKKLRRLIDRFGSNRGHPSIAGQLKIDFKASVKMAKMIIKTNKVFYGRLIRTINHIIIPLYFIIKFPFQQSYTRTSILLLLKMPKESV